MRNLLVKNKINNFMTYYPTECSAAYNKTDMAYIGKVSTKAITESDWTAESNSNIINEDSCEYVEYLASFASIAEQTPRSKSANSTREALGL